MTFVLQITYLGQFVHSQAAVEILMMGYTFGRQFLGHPVETIKSGVRLAAMHQYGVDYTLHKDVLLQSRTCVTFQSLDYQVNGQLNRRSTVDRYTNVSYSRRSTRTIG